MKLEINQYTLKLQQVQDKIGEILTNIVNDDYCLGCKHKLFCKHYNCTETKFRQLISRKTYCPAFKDLIGDIVEVQQILGEEDHE